MAPHKHCPTTHVFLSSRILEGHFKGDIEFDHEAAATLAIRGARQDSSGGYQFTRDLRLKGVRQPELKRVYKYTLVEVVDHIINNVCVGSCG